MRVVVLGGTGGWHAERLTAVLLARGHEVAQVPATRVVTTVADGGVTVAGPQGEALHAADAVLVRGVPRGSLEQVVFRVDTLHVLERLGVRVVNAARAIERTVDKQLASALLATAGVATPATVACERGADALAAFEALGGDVVVKPLFGAMGAGIARIEDRDVAHRVFRSLELERAVYYVQETVVGVGRRDLRALVVGGAVLGAIERRGPDWRANVARGAEARPAALSDEEAALCAAAAGALGVDVAGVDLLTLPGHAPVVVEVNGIPGWQAFERVTGIDVGARVVGLLEASRP